VSQLSIANFLDSVRRTVGDTGTSREATVRDERLDGVDGTTKRFTALFYPIKDMELRKTVGGVTTVLANPADYSFVADTGIITTVAAPQAGDPVDTLLATYHFYWYADADFYDFILDAFGMIGLNPTNQTNNSASARAANVLLQCPDGLLRAVEMFSAHAFNKRRAIEYANRFGSSSGGQSVNVDVVTKNFRDLGDEFYTEGVAQRDAYYTRFGATKAPASASPRGMAGLGIPYTPKR